MSPHCFKLVIPTYWSPPVPGRYKNKIVIDQLLNIVRQFGQETVVNNPDVPNEHNEEVMADATRTIASGFQNVMAGGGFQNILDLFRGGSGTGGILKNPMVSMMIGYFISKLVGKYNLSPSSASQIANRLIPDSISSLVSQTNDPGNPSATLDNFVGALVGKQAFVQPEASSASGGFSLQDLLDKFTGGHQAGGGGGFDLQDIIGNLTRNAQDQFKGQQSAGGGLMDLIKGFMK